MYGRNSFNSSWKTDEECDDHDDCSSVSPYSSADESEHELKELEELLYSQVHYVANDSYKDRNGIDNDDIIVTAVSDRFLAADSDADKKNLSGLEYTALDSSPSVTVKNAFGSDNVIIFQPSAGYPVENSFKRSPKQCVGSQSPVEISGSECSMEASEDRNKSLTIESSCRNSVPSIVSVLQDHQLQQSDESATKRLKYLTSTPANVQTKKPLTCESTTSESSYDAFCFEESSLDSFVTGGDTKINSFQEDNVGESDAVQLKKVLKSLPGLLFILLLHCTSG